MKPNIILFSFTLLIGVLFNLSSLTTEQELFLDGMNYFENGDYENSYNQFKKVNDSLGRYTARVTPYLVMSMWNLSEISGKRIRLSEIYQHVEALKQFDLSDSIFKDDLSMIIYDVSEKNELMTETIPGFIRNLDYDSMNEVDNLFWDENKTKKVKGSQYYKYVDLSWLMSRSGNALFYATYEDSSLSDRNIENFVEGINFRKKDLDYYYGIQRFQVDNLGDDLVEFLFKEIESNTESLIASFAQNIIQASNQEDYNEWYVKYQQSFTEDKYYVDFRNDRSSYLAQKEKENQEYNRARQERIEERERQVRNKKLAEGLFMWGTPVVTLGIGYGIATSDDSLAQVGGLICMASLGWLLADVVFLF